jgi:hypothetical protein
MRYFEIIKENANLRDAFYEVQSPEEITSMLEQADAETFKLPNGQIVYKIDDTIIIWDGKDIYPEIENIYDWLSTVDVDKIYPKYEQNWNDSFWKYPPVLYHSTPSKNIESIMQHGLVVKNETRGIGNRSVGSAVFTTTDYESAAAGHYGDTIIIIDTKELAKNPKRPYASEEPQISETNMRSALARILEIEYNEDEESGISPDTIILYGTIEPQYLSID